MIQGDSHYTPPMLADTLVKLVGRSPIGRVADFAVGDGRLLSAASRRWNDALMLGTDICGATIRRLRRESPPWSLGTCDFLDAMSRKRCGALAGMEGKLDAVLLNPPFSGRGGAKWHAKLGDEEVSCSQAMAFVLTATPYLAPEGEMVAILPAGTMRSVKDREAWRVVRSLCECHLAGRNGHRTFDQCYPRTVIVRIVRGRGSKGTAAGRGLRGQERVADGGGVGVSLCRGTIAMHTIDALAGMHSVPLVHTTEMRNGTVTSLDRLVSTDRSIVSGPVVLIPRVCEPSRGKVCLYLPRKEVALSACILGIRCRNQNDAKQVREVLLRRWALVEAEYGGTCARYITLEALSALLERLGFRVL